jgi:F-type H+-transporting ATPase subunit b
MVFNVWTFLFQVVNFLVLVAILRWLLYRPLRDAIDRRRDASARALSDAEDARRAAAALQTKLSKQLVELEQRRETVLREARRQAEAERAASIVDAEGTIRRRREESEQQLARDRDEALRSLRGELVHSAVELAQRLLREAADRTLNRQLAERLVEELRLIPDAERGRLRGEWDHRDGATVETAAELDGEVLNELGVALESVAGRPLKLSVEVRPALVSGVRLRIGGHVWDATMAGRLEELEAASASSVPP